MLIAPEEARLTAPVVSAPNAKVTDFALTLFVIFSSVVINSSIPFADNALAGMSKVMAVTPPVPLVHVDAVVGVVGLAGHTGGVPEGVYGVVSITLPAVELLNVQKYQPAALTVATAFAGKYRSALEGTTPVNVVSPVNAPFPFGEPVMVPLLA